MIKVYLNGNMTHIVAGGYDNSYPNGIMGYTTKSDSSDIFLYNRQSGAYLKTPEGNTVKGLFSDFVDEADAPLGATKEATIDALAYLLNGKVHTLPFNEPFAGGAYAQLVTNQDFLRQVALGLVTGYSMVLKSGRNPDVDTGSTPEDVWNGGNIYTGFPTTPAEELQVVSSSASDTGTVTFLYLASDTATAYTQSPPITLTGTTPVNTNINAYRVHTAWYTPPAPNTATGANAGIITIRHRLTPANVFIAMPIGTNQSYMAGYTIPEGYSGLLLDAKWIASGGGGVYADVAFWIRLKNQGFRLRRNNTCAFGTPSKDDIAGGLLLPAGTDIMPRVNTASANNTTVVCSYSILLVPNS